MNARLRRALPKFVASAALAAGIGAVFFLTQHHGEDDAHSAHGHYVGTLRAEGIKLQQGGDLPGAMARFREAIHVAEKHGLKAALVYNRIALATVHLTEERYEDAAGELQRAAEVAREIRNRMQGATALAYLGQALRLQGHNADALAALRESLELAGTTPSRARATAHFQMGEAFIVGYRHHGAGLYSLLFPILIGAFLPFSLLACIRLARRFWVVLATFGLALLLQYLATGISAAGFAILQPVSIMDSYVLLFPDSTAAKSREFAALLGNDGLIGIHQAWTMTLAAPSLVLVALLEFLPWARRRPLLAAPLFSLSMVLISALWFETTPPLRDYPATGANLILASLIAVGGGLLTGSLGLRLAGLVEPAPEGRGAD